MVHLLVHLRSTLGPPTVHLRSTQGPNGRSNGPMVQWSAQLSNGRSNGPMVGPMVQWSNGRPNGPMVGPRVQWSVQWSNVPKHLSLPLVPPFAGRRLKGVQVVGKTFFPTTCTPFSRPPAHFWVLKVQFETPQLSQLRPLSCHN